MEEKQVNNGVHISGVGLPQIFRYPQVVGTN